jgi:hypothetical protein
MNTGDAAKVLRLCWAVGDSRGFEDKIRKMEV